MEGVFEVAVKDIFITGFTTIFSETVVGGFLATGVSFLGGAALGFCVRALNMRKNNANSTTIIKSCEKLIITSPYFSGKVSGFAYYGDIVILGEIF